MAETTIATEGAGNAGLADVSGAPRDGGCPGDSCGPRDSQAPGSIRDAQLTHVNAQGRARMVDVGDKPATSRVARAGARVLMAPSTLELVRTGGTRKGDVLAVAQVAGIQAAKHTWELVPMCHQVPLSGVDVSFAFAPDGIEIETTARCVGGTGVEMEALAAASAAALTVYDMCKSHQRDMEIADVRVLEKDGGRSGHFVNEPQDAGRVVAVCRSEHKGTRKQVADAIELRVGSGVAGDAHAGAWHRQVSLLPDEAVDGLRTVLPDLAPGDFAENVLVRGLDLKALPVGTVLEVGTALVAVTQIGKQCHNDCEIKRLVGKCAMPTEGIFAVVVRDGVVRAGDAVRVRRL